ncbi:hypothetical protein TELCIR_06637 [Teladorsagia circumcincta]|uniref:Integrase catalytic domain-containing protein n=1 Tax=Teladorsagia circumcincta TaxID=45464 RepID=A0A2G9UMP4_TELCI|nr:hypothetical protein TELCIR_06637 [Teladorsagia circumcincta]
MDGISYLVVADAFSKWPELIPMTSTTSIATLGELRRSFAQFGIPITVSDNGTRFIYEEFQDYCRTWSKWRSMTGVFCDKNMPERLKPEIYRTVTTYD